MPELPEVESLRRGLAKYIIGQTIVRAEVKKPKLVSGRGNIRVASAAKVREFVREMRGEKISAVERRAKNIIVRFASGKALLIHLKMSGQLVYAEHGKNKALGGHPIEISESTLPNKHSHIIFTLTRGTLYYNDTRMFGYVLYFPSYEELAEAAGFSELGLEPHDKKFTAQHLFEGLKKKNTRLKTALMAQKVVVGLGNIYCDEVCFAAGVRPMRRTSSLALAEAKKLHAAIGKILPRAIALGGSSIATYRLADGSRGNYAREHKVYGRGGEKCLRCGKVLQTVQLGGRTTVWCGGCQN